MPYKPYESDGLNLVELIKDTGSSPAPDTQSEFKANLVKALWNLRRLAVAGSGDMLESVYDPGGIASSAFDMANMIEAADAKVLTAAERALITDLNDGDYDAGSRISTRLDSSPIESDWYGAYTTVTASGDLLLPGAPAGTGTRLWFAANSGGNTLKASGNVKVNNITYADGEVIAVLGPRQTVSLMASVWVGYWVMSIEANRPTVAELQAGTETAPRAMSPADIANYFLRWDDIRVSPVSTKLGGTSDPDFIKFKDNGAGSQGVFTYHFSPILEEEAYFEVQLPHSYKAGSDLKPHVHWAPVDANAGTVIWGLEYTIQSPNGTFGNTTILEVADNADGVAYKHQLHSLGTISGAGITESAVIFGRIYRKAGSDTYASDAALVSTDIHFQMDKMGSVDELPA